MNRRCVPWWVLVAVAVISAGLVAVIQLAGASSLVPIVGRTCYAGDDFASVIRVTVNDRTDVDLWCGDRLLVDGDRCLVQRGPVLTVVPCTRPSSNYVERAE